MKIGPARRAPVAAALAFALLHAATPLHAAQLTTVWNGQIADWEDPTQWSLGVVPNNTATDTYIATAVAGATLHSTITLDAIQQIGSLTITSGNQLTLTGATTSKLSGVITIESGASMNAANIMSLGQPNTPARFTGAGDFHLTGTTLWNNGSMLGTGTTYNDSGATLTLTALTLTTRGFVNNGTLTMPAAAGSSFVILSDGATVLNNGLWVMQSGISAIRFSSGSGAFVNHGTLEVDTGDISIPFNNDGIVTVSNSLGLPDGISTGTFNVAAGGVIGLGRQTLRNATLAGLGRYSGNITLDDTATTAVANAGFRTIAGTGNLTVSSSYVLHSINGSDNNYLLSTAGTITLLPGSTFSIPLDTNTNNYTPSIITLDHTTLRSSAATTVDAAFGGNTYYANVLFKNGATWTNAASLRIYNPLNLNTDNNTQNRFINSGSIIFNCTGTTSINAVMINVPLENSGSIVVQKGDFYINAGGTSSGTFLVDAAVLGVNPVRLFINSEFEFTGGTLGAPGPARDYISATKKLTINGDTTAYRLILGNVTPRLTGPVLAGTSKLTLSGGEWFSGTIANAGGLEIVGGTAGPVPITVNPATFGTPNFSLHNLGPKIFDGSPFHVAAGALVAWWHAGLSGPIVQPNSQIDLKNAATITNDGTFYTYVDHPLFNNADANAQSAFYNHGTFGRHAYASYGKTNLVTTLNLPFYNDGTVDIQAGAIDFAGGYFDTSSPGHTASFLFAPGAGLAFSGGHYTFGNAPLNLGPGAATGFGTLHNSLLLNGTLAATGGTLSVLGNITGAGTASVAAGASLIADALQLNALLLTGTASLRPNGGTSKLTALTLATDTNGTYTASLNLSNNPLILQSDSASKATTLAQLHAALAANALTSSTTAADPTHKTTVILDNALLGATSFGSLSVDANSLLLLSTWLGDSNLDRRVDVTDLGTLATYYGQAVPNGIPQGDFNNDGVVNVTDLGLLATNYGQGTAPGANYSLESDLSSFSVLSSVSPTPIPEPATLALLLPALLLGRNRMPRRRLRP